MTVDFLASGLERKHGHPAHIHGFVTDKKSTVSFKDYNHNGDIDDYEGELFVGPVLQPLTIHDGGKPYFDYSYAPHGVAKYKTTYDLASEPGLKDALTPPGIRAVEIHGMTSDGLYDPEFPVAAGLLKQVSGSSSKALSASDASGSPAAAPLPPAVWAGLMTMFGWLGIAKLRRRFARA